MTLSSFMFLLTLGLISSGIQATDARYSGLMNQKKLMSRRQMGDAVESTSSKAPVNSSDAVLTKLSFKSHTDTLPQISMSLARKLSDMLAIAVAEAVAQVVEGDPGKWTACSALLRGQGRKSIANANENSNTNYNVNSNSNSNSNTNNNINGIKNLLPESEEEEVDEEISEEDFSSDEEVSEDVETEEDLSESEEEANSDTVEKPVVKTHKKSKSAKRSRQKNKNKNSNNNKNVNINTNIMRRRLRPS